MSADADLIEAGAKLGFGPIAVQHSIRFRKISNRYPHTVALAYGHDLERAARDTDEQVAATVAAWERDQGAEPRDWHAIGADERYDDEEAPAA